MPIEVGFIPELLTARTAEIPAWDEIPDDPEPVLARQLELCDGLHDAHQLGHLAERLAFTSSDRLR